ncbi:MAG: hypothetical protein MHPSP_003958, partial [Paramarteilia canceri]
YYKKDQINSERKIYISLETNSSESKYLDFDCQNGTFKNIDSLPFKDDEHSKYITTKTHGIFGAISLPPFGKFLLTVNDCKLISSKEKRRVFEVTNVSFANFELDSFYYDADRRQTKVTRKHIDQCMAISSVGN